MITRRVKKENAAPASPPPPVQKYISKFDIEKIVKRRAPVHVIPSFVGSMLNEEI